MFLVFLFLLFAGFHLQLTLWYKSFHGVQLHRVKAGTCPCPPQSISVLVGKREEFEDSLASMDFSCVRFSSYFLQCGPSVPLLFLFASCNPQDPKHFLHAKCEVASLTRSRRTRPVNQLARELFDQDSKTLCGRNRPSDDENCFLRVKPPAWLFLVASCCQTESGLNKRLKMLEPFESI